MAIQSAIIGNLGGDAKLVTLGQTQALEFSLASRRSRKDKNGQAVTDWVDVVYFKTALQPYLTKGRMVQVTGEQEIHLYTTRQGEVKYGIKVTANSIEFCGGTQQEQGAAQEQAMQQPQQPPQQQYQQPPQPPQQGGDDLPF